MTRTVLPLASALFLAAIAPLALHARQLDTPIPVEAEDAETLISALTIPPEDELARDWAVGLAKRSPTFRQMLGVLQSSNHLIVRLRSVRGLRRDARLYGRGVFYVEESHVLGLLEFEPMDAPPQKQLEMIAHEVAHAVELACLPMPGSLDELRAQLASRSAYEITSSSGLMETPFPQTVARAVLREYSRKAARGELHALATQFGLNLPDTADDVDVGR